MDETLERGEGKNFEIQPDGPVFDVVEIALDAFFKRGIAAPAVDLRPARDPGFDLLT